MGTSITSPTPKSSAIPGSESSLWLRLLGALVAGSLSALAAAISAWLDLYWWSLGSGGLALLGVTVGVVLGFIAGPVVAQARRPVLHALGLAASAAIVGWTVICVASLVGIGWTGFAFPSSSLGDVLFLGLVGLPTAVVYALPVTGPVAFVGVAILRLAADSRFIGALAVALSMSLAALASVLAGSVPPPELSLDEPSAAVDLEWTLVNRTARPLELGIFEHFPDGYGGSVAEIVPCFTTIGREGVGRNWFLTLDPESVERTPPELVSALQAPGSNVSVRVEVAPDGVATVHLGRGAPSAEELTVDHCLDDGAR